MEPQSPSISNYDQNLYELIVITKPSQTFSQRNTELIQIDFPQEDGIRSDLFLESNDIHLINTKIFQYLKAKRRILFQVIYNHESRKAQIQSIVKKLLYGDKVNQSEVIQKLPR